MTLKLHYKHALLFKRMKHWHKMEEKLDEIIELTKDEDDKATPE
jgi:hypothetical protein